MQDTTVEFESSPSIRTDSDLLTRIRSLLISRNEQNPPKTPPPSPDYSFSPNPGFFAERTPSFDFNTARSVAKLARSETEKLTIVAAAFNKPPRRFSVQEVYVRRHPKDLSEIPAESSSLDSIAMLPSTSLNLKAIGDHVGGDYGRSMSLPSLNFDPSILGGNILSKGKTQVPQTLPAVTRPISVFSQQERPEQLFHHESSQSVRDIIQTTHTEPTITATVPADWNSKVESRTPALTAGDRSQLALEEAPMHKHKPESTLKARTSVKQLLSTTRADLEDEAGPATKLLSSGLAHSHAYNYSEGNPSEMTETDRDRANYDFYHANGKLQGPQLAKILSQLPPVNSAVVDMFDGQHLTAKPAAEAVDGIRDQSAFANNNGSVFQYEQDVLTSRRVSSLQTPNPKDSGWINGDHSKSKYFDHQSSNTVERKIATSAGQHDSTISRTLSPGPGTDPSYQADTLLPTGRSDDKEDADNRASVLKNSGSSRSSSEGSASTVYVEAEALSYELERPRQMSLLTPDMAAKGAAGLTSRSSGNWVKHIINRRSTVPIKRHSTILTARPHHKERQEANTSALRRVQSMGLQHRPEHGSGHDDLELSLIMNKRSMEESAYVDSKRKESFAKNISDLENLLEEALIIARQAPKDAPVALPPADTIDTLPSTLMKAGKWQTADSDEKKNPLSSLPRVDPEPNLPKDDTSTIALNSCLPFGSTDWAFAEKSERLEHSTAGVSAPPATPRKPVNARLPGKEQMNVVVRESSSSASVPSQESIEHYIQLHQLYDTSHAQRSSTKRSINTVDFPSPENDLSSDGPSGDPLADRYDPNQLTHETRSKPVHNQQGIPEAEPDSGLVRRDTNQSLRTQERQPHSSNAIPDADLDRPSYNLDKKHHHSIRDRHGFSLSSSHRRAPIARDWSTPRKRFVAAVACISTALIGLIVGIYAGEVPAIQYSIVDRHHYTILGNVLFYIGLALPTLLLWPLPLLHGRKPYTLAALALLMALQFPQAIVVGTARTNQAGTLGSTINPSAASYRVGLLLSRALSGLAAGFANINFQTTLLDLFGASLRSGNPHQEVVNENDVRRHGGGMGVWLGIWTWCFIGSIGTGFLIGALVISGVNVSWGFYIVVVLAALVLLLNVITPEVRRSPYRRSMTEVRTGTDISRRVARGEIKMHVNSTGPKWWWEEVIAGQILIARMLKQPGFVVLSLYLGWIYGQMVMIIVLLGALTSKYYKFHPQYVGLCVMAIPIGALLAIPFQKASLFSRARHHAPRTDSMTFEKRVTWTSHLVRRSIFMIVLPFAGLAYTLASGGPHIPFIIPTLFAGLIGFLSNLAIAECNGIMMETYDTSDLQPGMTGRARHNLPEEIRKKRTNFSSFPRVSAGFAVSQTFAFAIAAAATGTGGAIERRLGAQTATAVVAGILLILTLMLIAVLTRFKNVQVIPTKRYGTNILSGPEDEWKPVIIGHPSGTTRRMSVLELGKLSRWNEIRRRNLLTGLEQEDRTK